MCLPLLICNICLEKNFEVTSWFSRKEYHDGVLAMNREKVAQAVDESLTCIGHASSRDRSKKKCSRVESALSLEARDQNPYLFHFHVLNWAENPLVTQKVDELYIDYSPNKSLTITESKNFKAERDINDHYHNSPSWTGLEYT